MCLWICTCSQRGKIPRSELEEIRRVLAAASNARLRHRKVRNAESRYQPPTVHERNQEARREGHLKTEGQGKDIHDPFSDVEWFSEKPEHRVPAVASIKGVELSPRTPTLCLIKFDFEPNPNPHTELPEDQATAERFERPGGSHYWLIRWK
jgi:hypothetical protein